MNPIRSIFLVIFSIFLNGISQGAEGPSLDPHLEPFRPLLEKTWRGQFKNSKPDKPTVDIMRWERALNGKAVRILHSINEGVYGGETLLIWDAKKQSVVFYYFTTGGFMTTGTMEFKEGKILSHEIISGEAGGVTEVRGTSRIQSDGSFHVKSEHLKNGQWSPGHEVIYHEAPDAKVIFK
jgi:hypothetical protein